MEHLHTFGNPIRKVNPRFDPNDKKRPVGRSGHCMTSDESDFFLYGGYSPADTRNGINQNRVLPELWRFNFASEEWVKLDTDDTPSTCASASIKMRNKQLFIFGGTGYPFGHIMSNTIKKLNLRHPKNLEAAGEKCKTFCCTQNVWQLIETNPMSYSSGGEEEDNTPYPAYGQSLIFHKDYIYVFGGAVGYYSEAVASLHRLNTDTLIWENLRPTGKQPSGRYKQEIAEDSENEFDYHKFTLVVDRLIRRTFNYHHSVTEGVLSFYVFGGGRLYHAESLEKIYKYNYAQNHWMEIQTQPDPVHGYPKARCSFGFSQEGTSVYVSGGRHYSMEVEHEALSDFWHLRLDTLKWDRLKLLLPKPLYFHCSVISPGGYMFIFGGVLPDGMRSPYLFRLRLPNYVPKLLELSWEKVCEPLRRIKKVNQETLSELGVPWNLVERISN